MPSPPSASSAVQRQDLSSAVENLSSLGGLLPVTSGPDGTKRVVLSTARVSQLDADQLDEEVCKTLRGQAERVAKSLGMPGLARYGPEVDALWRLLLWAASTRLNTQSPGQVLQNVRYRNEHAFAAPHLSSVLSMPRVLSLLLVVAVPWTWTRLRELAADWSLEDWRGQVLERADRAWRVLSTAHLLVFIYNGKYKSLADRLSGMRLVQAQNEAVRSVSLDFINQQLFFDGFTELLVCLLPLIDFAWLQRLASRLYRRFRLVALRVVSRQPLQDVHDSACVSCGLDPAVMRHVSSCGHSWCYWCIKVDQTGVCPACGEYITDAHRG